MPDLITLTSPHGSAELDLLGGQVVAARIGERDLLWRTPQPVVPLRGGVPVCFPWFGAAGVPSHGFARRLPWRLERSSADDDRATLVLEESPESLALWPHHFRARLTVSIGTTLDIGFEVTNTDAELWEFTYALHTYFATADLPNWRLDGLGPQLTAAEPIDAVFEQAPGRLGFDGLYLTETGMPSAVVWNPGPNDAVDIGSAYRDFVCVERGRIGSAAIRLDPGTQHTSSMQIGRTDS